MNFAQNFAIADVGMMHAVTGINQFLKKFYVVSGHLEQYTHTDDIYSNLNLI